MIDFIREQMQSQIVGGGLLLMLAGAAMALARHIPHSIYVGARRRLVVELEVTNETPMYDIISRWLNSLSYSKRARRLSASDNGKRLLLTPAPGLHFFLYEGRLMWLSREREREDSGGGGSLSRYKFETITLRTFGRDPTVLRRLVEQVYADVQKERDSKIGVFAPNSYGDWMRMDNAEPRPMASVVLPPGVAERLLSDAAGFLRARERFRELGVPWRRGYLLYGPPGTGKTSLVQALATELGLSLYVLSLSSRAIKDEDLAGLMNDVPVETILLIEDIDCVTVNRSDDAAAFEQAAKTGVTLAGLLNAIDGVGASEGRILIMTTNYPDRLDAALVRAGRIDVRQELSFCTPDMIDRMFLRFFPDEDPAPFRAEMLHRGLVTTADVQGALIERGGWWATTHKADRRSA